VLYFSEISKDCSVKDRISRRSFKAVGLADVAVIAIGFLMLFVVGLLKVLQ
jgi:hypothetical protein